MSLANTLAAKLSTLANFLWPPNCLGCQGPLDTPHALCGECWQEICFLSDPLCWRCGAPLPFVETDCLPENEQNLLCAGCIAQPPQFVKARAIMAYKGLAASLILQFKRNPASPTLPFFERLLERTAKKITPTQDPGPFLVAPVPLHWRRLLSRGYNQSGRLALSLSKKHPNTLLALDLLRKSFATKSQGQFNKKARLQNVKGSFAINNKWLAHKNKPVLLIDDVWTTGATLNACLKVLAQAGFKKTYVVTLARVL